jgi:hypothetical protein
VIAEASRFVTGVPVYLFLPADLAAVIAATAELVAQVQAHQATASTRSSAYEVVTNLPVCAFLPCLQTWLPSLPLLLSWWHRCRHTRPLQLTSAI